MLEWKSDYETGVLAIDTQHQVLFNNINRLEGVLIKATVERSEADYLLAFLENYAAQHFSGEEACMARYHCPAYAKNKEDHAQFLNILKLAREQYEATNAPGDVLRRLHETMVWWINDHILKVDIRLRGCTDGRQV
jgi:hemerythrin